MESETMNPIRSHQRGGPRNHELCNRHGRRRQCTDNRLGNISAALDAKVRMVHALRGIHGSARAFMPSSLNGSVSGGLCS
jgi:hypothetical protein